VARVPGCVQVCLKMRSLTPGVPPPIIMISGKASTKDVIKGLQVRAAACQQLPARSS
jgi:DNA-binding response OmpR family regulator